MAGWNNYYRACTDIKGYPINKNLHPVVMKLFDLCEKTRIFMKARFPDSSIKIFSMIPARSFLEFIFDLEIDLLYSYMDWIEIRETWQEAYLYLIRLNKCSYHKLSVMGTQIIQYYQDMLFRVMLHYLFQE